MSRILCALLCLASLLPAVKGQTATIQGSFVGTVTDATGAPVSNVNVTAVNTSTNISNRVQSGNDGFFRVERLLPGPYTITAEHPSFKTFVREGLTLSGAQAIRIQIRLELGSVAERVEVVATTPMIETESPAISAVRGWEDRKFLPTRSPDFFSTTALEPGAITGNPSFEVSFAGSRAGQYVYSLNGSTFRARPAADSTIIANFNEWQQEVKSSYVNNSAEYDTLANVNVVSKSGANSFHGSGVWYYTSGGMQSRNPFSPTSPSGVTHIIADSIGGPIIRNRAFFYFSHSGQRDSSSVTRNNTTPTALMRQGNFSEISTPIIDPLTRAPFPGNVIPQTRLFPGSVAYLNKYFALPNYGGAGFSQQNYRASFAQPTASDSYFSRIDWKISDRHSVFASYNITWGNRGKLWSGNITYPDQIGPRVGFRRPQAATLSDTYTFTPYLFNELNLGWSREHNYIVGSTQGRDALATLGVSGVSALNVPGMPVLNIAGFTTPGQQSFQDIAEDSYTIRDNVSFLRGRHRMKFGVVAGEYRSAQVPFTIDNFLGVYNFTNTFATNYALADFLLGYPQSVSRQNAQFYDRVYRKSRVLELYAQDDFQLSSRLTVNYGVRYQFHQPFIDKNGRSYSFDPASQTVVVLNDNSLRLLNPLLIGSVSFKTAQQAGFPERLVSSDKNNFAPRIGMAYRLSDRTVVRAGFGIFYDFNFPLSGNVTPFIPSETFPPNTLINGVPQYSFPNPFPSTPNAAGSLSIDYMNPNAVVPYSEQWSATVERQFSESTALRLSYIGTRGLKFIYTQPVNVPMPSTTAFSQSRRPLPQFGAITIQQNGQQHNYNSLQAVFTHRTRNGLYFRSHYTLAKDIGDESTLNPFDRTPDRGQTSWQRNHTWISEFNWELPFGQKHKLGGNWPSVVQHLVGNWSMSGILNIASGYHLTPSYSGYDASGTGILSGRPDRTGDGNLPSDQRSASRWFDASAFAIPGANPSTPLRAPSGPIGRFGNSGVGIIDGPGLWQFDLSVVRQMRFLDGKLRASLFGLATNVFNHPNLGNPAMDISVPGQVGQITGIQTDGNASGVGVRSLRIGLRMEF